MRVFARMKNINDPKAGRFPYSYNVANAVDGFQMMGVEIIFYNSVSEIYDEYELGDIVLDGVGQVNYCLSKFGIKPGSLDYPKCLEKYLGRKVWKDTINHINATPELWGNFVKPIKEKLFTGRVINSPKDLIGCGSCYEDYEVLVSEPLDIVYECRGFVLYDELFDLRHYNGIYEYMKHLDIDLIKKAMEDWKTWEGRPNSCALDFGVVRKKKNVQREFLPSYVSKYNKKANDKNINIVTSNEYVYETVLIEANLPYALGCYGLNSIDYAKMISAYISQISGIKDELKL